MTTSHSPEKWEKNCDISTTAWPILTKFGMVVHQGHPDVGW